MTTHNYLDKAAYARLLPHLLRIPNVPLLSFEVDQCTTITQPPRSFSILPCLISALPEWLTNGTHNSTLLHFSKMGAVLRHHQCWKESEGTVAGFCLRLGDDGRM